MSMTITVTGVVSDTTSVLVPTIVKATLKQSKSVTSNGTTVVTYENEASDARYHDYVVVSTRKTAPNRGAPGYIEYSVEHVTNVKLDDSVDTIGDVYHPMRTKLSGRFPDVGMTPAQVLQTIGTVYGLFVPSASSGVPAATLAGKILFGNSNAWY